MVFWITGITASGKTFLGKSLKRRLIEYGYKNVIHLDGEELRKRPDWITGHTLKDRFKIISLLVKLINEETRNRNHIIVSTVSHIKEMRKQARQGIKDFNEIYLKCDPEICESRDYKGFYKRAKLFEQKKMAHSDTKDKSHVDRKVKEDFFNIEKPQEIFPGITEQYEESINVELTLYTDKETEEISIDRLLKYCLKKLKKK